MTQRKDQDEEKGTVKISYTHALSIEDKRNALKSYEGRRDDLIIGQMYEKRRK